MAWLASALALSVLLGQGAAAADRFGDATPDAPTAATASGAEADILRPVVDRIIGAAVAREAIPGAVVGISRGGRRSYFGYSGTGTSAYDPDTIVEIGSITKVFTTALFAEAVDEGRMRADAPLRTYLPGLRLHPCTAQITPLQLADFTSGLPTLPGGLPRPLSERGIATYTTGDFLAWISRWAPEDGDGERCDLPAPYRYSNASVGLLGHLVAERLGAPWEALLRDRITGPLGMISTAVTVPPAQRGRVAQGYGPEGRPAMPWPVFAWYAAGALRSDATDMLAFGEAALGHGTVDGRSVPPPLLRALRQAMTPVYQPEGQVFRQGLAWIEEVGDPDEGQRPVFLKDGGTDGFSTVLVVNPGKDMVVFVAASRPNGALQRLGVTLSRHIR